MNVGKVSARYLKAQKKAAEFKNGINVLKRDESRMFINLTQPLVGITLPINVDQPNAIMYHGRMNVMMGREAVNMFLKNSYIEELSIKLMDTHNLDVKETGLSLGKVAKTIAKDDYLLRAAIIGSVADIISAAIGRDKYGPQLFNAAIEQYSKEEQTTVMKEVLTIHPHLVIDSKQKIGNPALN